MEKRKRWVWRLYLVRDEYSGSILANYWKEASGFKRTNEIVNPCIVGRIANNDKNLYDQFKKSMGIFFR
jgi:hypothetical protein